MAALAITEGKLAANSVATAKIIDLAVTAAKIAAAAITEEKVAGEAISTAKIKALAVTAAKLAAEAVETGKIATAAVTAAKIAASAVEEAKIKDAAVTSRKFKPTTGLVSPSEDLTLTTSYADIPGTERSITPSVASILKVWVNLYKTVSANEEANAVLTVDGVDQSRIIRLLDNVEGAGGFQLYAVSLTAAEHKVKLRAKRVGTGSATIDSSISCYLYELVAS